MSYRLLIWMAALASCAMSATAEEILLRVVDSQDAAIPGAAVEVRSLGSRRTVISGVTNQEGVLSVKADLPVEVQVTAPGFDPLRQKVETAPSGGVRLPMTPAALHTTIEVVVRGEGAPVSTVEQSALEIDRGGARTAFDAVEKLVPSAYVTRRGIMGFGLGQSGSMTLRGIG